MKAASPDPALLGLTKIEPELAASKILWLELRSGSIRAS